MYIYKVTNKATGKIYVGQSRRKDPSYLGSGVHIKLAVEKYGNHEFSKEYIDEATNQDELDEKERYWIKKLKAQDKSIGYNIADGGWNHFTINEEIKQKISNTLKKKYKNGNNRTGTTLTDAHKKAIGKASRGRLHSEESKRRMSEAHTGKKHSEESKSKMSEAHTGKKLSESHKAKISKGLVGRPVSEETKKLLSKKNLNKTQKNSKRVKAKNKITGEEFLFNNISQAARELNTYRHYIKNNCVKNYDICILN